jgi:acyl carrier protein
METVSEQVCRILSEQLMVEVKPGSPIKEICYDSLSLIQAVVELELQMNLDIPNSVLDKFVIVQDVITYVEQQRAI